VDPVRRWCSRTVDPSTCTTRNILEGRGVRRRDLHPGVSIALGARSAAKWPERAQQEDRLDQVAARLLDRRGLRFAIVQRPFGHHVDCHRELWIWASRNLRTSLIAGDARRLRRCRASPTFSPRRPDRAVAQADADMPVGDLTREPLSFPPIATCGCRTWRAPTRGLCWRWAIRRSAAMDATIPSPARFASVRSRWNLWLKMSASPCRSVRSR